MPRQRKKKPILPEDAPELAKELARKLREVLDDDVFILGTLSCVRSPRSQRMLLDYIGRKEPLTVPAVATAAYLLSRREDLAAEEGIAS